MCSLPRNMFYIHVPFYSHLHSNYHILPCICSLPTFYFLWTTSFWSLNSSFWFIPSWHGVKKSLQVAFYDIYVNNTFLKPWTSESNFLLSWLSQFSWIAPYVTWVHVCTMSQRNALQATLPYFPLGSWVDSSFYFQSLADSGAQVWEWDGLVRRPSSYRPLFKVDDAGWFSSGSVSWLPTVCQQPREPLNQKLKESSWQDSCSQKCPLEWRGQVYNTLT